MGVDGCRLQHEAGSASRCAVANLGKRRHFYCEHLLYHLSSNGCTWEIFHSHRAGTIPSISGSFVLGSENDSGWSTYFPVEIFAWATRDGRANIAGHWTGCHPTTAREANTWDTNPPAIPVTCVFCIALIHRYGRFHKRRYPRMMVSNGNSHINRWFRGTPILGSHHIRMYDMYIRPIG